MEQPSLANFGARRDEDIALDLLKFIAVTASVGRPAAPTAGFVAGSAPKTEDQVAHLLDLYGRCLKAVVGK
jgi:hypothetical protein